MALSHQSPFCRQDPRRVDAKTPAPGWDRLRDRDARIDVAPAPIECPHYVGVDQPSDYQRYCIGRAEGAVASIQRRGVASDGGADRDLSHPSAKSRATVTSLLPTRAGPGCDNRAVTLNHVALTVADRERSATFYGEHFGLTERIHEDDDRLILGSDDGSELALSHGEPVAAGLPQTNHFGFRLADDGAVRAARERFRAAGLTETDWQDDGRFVRVQVADPDGYLVEVYAH